MARAGRTGTAASAFVPTFSLTAAHLRHAHFSLYGPSIAQRFMTRNATDVVLPISYTRL